MRFETERPAGTVCGFEQRWRIRQVFNGQHQKTCALRVSHSPKNGGQPYLTCRKRLPCTFSAEPIWKGPSAQSRARRHFKKENSVGFLDPLAAKIVRVSGRPFCSLGHLLGGLHEVYSHTMSWSRLFFIDLCICLRGPSACHVV